MECRTIAAFALIPGGIWTFFAGLYFAVMWAKQFPHGIMLMMGGVGLTILAVAAAVLLWPKPDAQRTPRPIKAVLLSESDQ